jgi:hypothetical protein
VRFTGSISLFITDLTTLRTPWIELKADAGNPTLSHLRDLDVLCVPRALPSVTKLGAFTVATAISRATATERSGMQRAVIPGGSSLGTTVARVG